MGKKQIIDVAFQPTYSHVSFRAYRLKLELAPVVISDPGPEVTRNRSALVRDRLRGLIVGILDSRFRSKPLCDDDMLVDIGVASIDMVRLLLLIESEFDIEIPSHEITADAFKSISTIDALLERLGAIGVSST